MKLRALRSLKQITKEGEKNQQLWGETRVAAASSFLTKNKTSKFCLTAGQNKKKIKKSLICSV